MHMPSSLRLLGYPERFSAAETNSVYSNANLNFSFRGCYRHVIWPPPLEDFATYYMSMTNSYLNGYSKSTSKVHSMLF
jgi:hypothetical protein